jgi:uncharacterized protein YraI
MLAGCSVQVNNEGAATATPFIVTATLPPTLAPRPSESPLPPPPQPTVPPVEGTASTQINVRAEPSTASEVLGIIPANTKVEITGRDPGGNWWQIIYPTGVHGKGWVTAQYITTATQPEVPVIGGDESNPVAENSAVVIQQLNIRSGPGTSFNSLGILNANDVVSLTGKNSGGSWLQIEFAEGPEGKGWINAAFVRADGVDGLPIVSDIGEVIGTGTPANTALPPTPTIVPASMDFDSPESPIKTVILEDAGTSTILYNGDVSAPAGDQEDWLEFTPFSSRILLEVTCKGSDPHIELIQGEQTRDIHCTTQNIIPVESGQAMQVHVSAIEAGPQNYSSYTLKVTTIP